MKKLTIRKARQAGFTFIELMGVLAVAGVIIGGALYYKGRAGNSQKVDATVSSISNMASKLTGYYQNEGGYTNVSAASVNGMQLVAPPLTWDGTNIRDPWGNVVSVAGGTTSFAITLGGTTAPLDRETCVAIATQLASNADYVDAGASLTTTNGSLAGGGVYKSVSTGTTSMATLTSTTGCATTPSGGVMVGAQYH